MAGIYPKRPELLSYSCKIPDLNSPLDYLTVNCTQKSSAVELKCYSINHI